MTALLEAKGVTVWRGETLLLDDVSLTLGYGQALQLRGSNGSGKTTLLRVMIGLTQPDEGEVVYDGKPLHRHFDQLTSTLLYLGHRPGVSASLNAVENLNHFAKLNQATDVNIRGVLSELAFTELQMSLPCRSLSAGQQRRVALARLKLSAATLWVLDEPLSALDVHGQAWVTKLIEEHLDRNGSVLLTTHQPLHLPPVHSHEFELNGTRA